ncbi:MAG: M56 family metallopeptidase [Planctomycetota bacterium]|jgi:beta-lactamase regulating signal transducer with metallopeptidase domain/regulation of enolase protein 1 (concanavalin A-like superfamily)
MEDYLIQITRYLLAQSWQIAILVVAITAVTLALKNKSAHIRYLLWLIVLAKCLVPPLLAIPLPILPPEKSVEPVPLSTAQIPMLVYDVDDTTVPELIQSDLDPTPEQTLPVGTEAPSSSMVRQRLTVHQKLSIVWIIGATVFFLAATIKALRTNLYLRRRREPQAEKLYNRIENQLADLDFRPLPKVWLIEGIGQPLVWGLLRGSIYLPADFVKVNNAEQRRNILGHELCHVLRFDAAVNLLQVIAQGMFWFHPFVWWANKKIRAEREKCCDEMAIARLGARAKDYSTAIIKTLITEHKSTRPVPSLAVAGPVKNIEERIKTMMRPGKKFYKHPSLVAAIAVIVLALLTVPTGLVLTARAERPNPVAEEAVDNSRGSSKLVGSDQNGDTGVKKNTIPEANLQIPNELRPCAERLRTIYYALKRYEKDKGSLPDWLSDLVPNYLGPEMLIWPEGGPKSTPLAAESHLPCSFGYQYSSVTQVPPGGQSYRQFKDQERKIWGDVVPLVRYYVGQQCLNLSFDGRIYFSGTPWEKEIPTLSGQVLANLKATLIPVSPTQALAPTTARPWGPEQAIGAPDTQGAGDFPTAWAPLKSDAGPEWLKVDFERAVKIAALRVRESFNPGAISKISAILEDGREHVLWEGQDPTSEVSADADFVLRIVPTGGVSLLARGYSGFSVLKDIELEEDVVSKSIKIYLDTKRKRGWNEIDAVQLFGKDGSKQWACHATASSTHATGIIRLSPSVGDVSQPATQPTTSIQPVRAKGRVLAFDDFDGKLSLKWDILRPDKSHYSLSKRPGTLTITTQDGHFKEANADYENVFLIDTPASPDQDFQVTTCLLAFQPLDAYNQAGLIFWDDEDNYLEWVYQKMDRRGLNFNAGIEADGPTQYTYIPAKAPPEKLWLRVTKRDSFYECASSIDGKSFTVHTVENWDDGSPKRVGLFGLNGSLTQPPEVEASFDSFEVSEVPAVPAGTASGTAKFTIPQANLQIPGEMRGCTENLQAIYAALKVYEKDKGRAPDRLSQLVPRYLGPQTLFCPQDPSRKSSYWPDPNLPCSYCYELNPTELRSRPPLDKTMRHYKTLQRKLLGDVVPIVRCFHHGRVLNLSWDGQLYTSTVMFERLFAPDYRHDMLPAAPLEPNEPLEKVEAVPEPKGFSPTITFEKVVHDFGDVGPNTKKTGEFKFTNTGEGLLKITKVGRCCGIVTKLDRAEYAPGESGVLKAGWNSGPQPSVFRRKLAVHSNDKTNPEVTLTIKAKVVLKVAWEPKRLRLLLDEENAGSQNITISSTDNQPFSITGFKSTADCITADYDPSVQATKFILEPKVNAEKLQKNLKGRINISLSHPQGKAATILFNVLPKYTVNPPLIIVFNAEPEKPIVRKISVLNNYGEDFEIESVSSKGDTIAIKLLEQKKIRSGYQLDMEITPPAAESKIRFMDVFSINIKHGEKLAISCNGYYSKSKLKT